MPRSSLTFAVVMEGKIQSTTLGIESMSFCKVCNGVRKGAGFQPGIDTLAERVISLR